MGDSYLDVVSANKKAKSITEQRLYIETMEEILPEIKKYILSSDSKSGFMNILPFGDEVLKKGGVK